MKPLVQILLADYINPISDKSCLLVRQGAMAWSIESGLILELGDRASILRKYPKSKVIDASGQLALPGFFDMHFHWVQDEVRQKPKASLLKWLSEHTWPYESKFKDKAFSSQKSKDVGLELLKAGTLGGACYASLHPHTTDHALKNFVGDYIVGNVLMTMNSPDYLCHSESEALRMVEDQFNKHGNKYALTPRFAPTTHPGVMREGSKFAKNVKGFIQTHLSETPNEIDYVMSLYKDIKGFEKVKSYTEIYKKSGILGPRTMMGHGIHLTPKEWGMLKDTNTAVAHCPTSNAPVNQKGLGSGLFDFQKAERNKVRWSLATDIGGGPYLSMLDVMRSFVSQNQKAKNFKATFTKALFRSTLSGAEFLGLSKTNGSFAKNKFANFVLFDSPRVTKGENGEDVLRRLISKESRYSLENIAMSTWFKGKKVYSS